MHNILFVDKSGNDSTGTGDISNPLLTVAKALSMVASPSDTNRWAVNVGSGLFSETAIVIPPWTWIVGYNGKLASGNSQIEIAGGGNITISSDWAAGNLAGGLKDVNVSGSTNIVIDRHAIPGATGVDIFDICDCEVFGSVIFRAASQYDEFNIINAIVDSDVDISGGFNTIQNLICFGNVNVDTAEGVNSYATDIFDCWMGQNLSVASSGTATAVVNLRASLVDGTISQSGSGSTVNTRLPAYSPSVPANWATPPANIETALNEVALASKMGSAFTGTIALAKLTPLLGIDGSLTVANGIITAYTAPT